MADFVYLLGVGVLFRPQLLKFICHVCAAGAVAGQPADTAPGVDRARAETHHLGVSGLLCVGAGRAERAWPPGVDLAHAEASVSREACTLLCHDVTVVDGGNLQFIQTRRRYVSGEVPRRGVVSWFVCAVCSGNWRVVRFAGWRGRDRRDEGRNVALTVFCTHLGRTWRRVVVVAVASVEVW